MASFVFDIAKRMIGEGNTIRFTDTNYLKVALVDGSFFDDADAPSKTKWADISNDEITNFENYFGYSQQFLKNVQAVDDTSAGGSNLTNTVLIADDVAYGNTSTITARGAVIFIADTNQTLLVAIDFGQDILSTNGVYTLKFADNGFLKIR